MPSRHDHDAVLREIATGLADDDRLLARRLAAGPTYPLRRVRRWCAAVLVATVAVATVGLLAASAGAAAVAGGVGLLAAMTVGGLSIVLWTADRHAGLALAPASPVPGEGDDGGGLGPFA